MRVTYPLGHVQIIDGGKASDKDGGDGDHNEVGQPRTKEAGDDLLPALDHQAPHTLSAQLPKQGLQVDPPIE
jgi:hypothetical protein